MEKSVVQLSSDMCSGHVKCTTCAVDPQCAWLVKKGKCSSLVDVERGYAGSVFGSLLSAFEYSLRFIPSIAHAASLQLINCNNLPFLRNYLSNPEVDSPLNFCLAETNCSKCYNCFMSFFCHFKFWIHELIVNTINNELFKHGFKYLLVDILSSHMHLLRLRQKSEGDFCCLRYKCCRNLRLCLLSWRRISSRLVLQQSIAVSNVRRWWRRRRRICSWQEHEGGWWKRFQALFS